MDKLVLDYETLAKLRAATVLPCEVYDPAGNLVAYLTPADPFAGVDLNALNRRMDDPNAKWHTPDEVMARLRSLRKAA